MTEENVLVFEEPIQIDYEKCKEPMFCRKCLEACIPGVFALVPLEDRAKVRREPRIWKLTVGWPNYCNECGVCVKVCPTGALSLKKKH